MGGTPGRRIPRAARARVSATTTTAAPPVDATLTRIDYDLRIDGDAVAGRARLTIDVLRDGWTRVQIPAGLMVRDAQLDGQPVPLVEGPPPHVLLSRAGRVVLALDIALPLVGRQRDGIDRASRVRVADLARDADASARRRGSLGERRLRRRSHRSRGREPVDDVRATESAADAVVEAEGGRSARRAAAAHRGRAHHAIVGLGEDVSQVAASGSASRSCRAWRARSRSRFHRASWSTR